MILSPGKTVASYSIKCVWHQNYVGLLPTDFSFVAPPPFEFNFVKDSFFALINLKSDNIADTTGCQYLDWIEYAKGTYTINENQLLHSGIYTEADYSIKTAGCYNMGPYTDTIKIRFCNDRLILNWDRKYYSEISSRDCKMYLMLE